MKLSVPYKYIFIVGMNRSASTWVYNTVRLILGKYDNCSASYEGEGQELDEFLRSSDDSDNVNIVKFHEPTDIAMELIRSGKACAVYSHRDIREVALSLINFMGVTFKEMTDDGVVERILAQHRKWVMCAGVLRLEYNSIIFDPAANVRLIAKYLGIDIDKSDIDLVLNENSLEANKRKIDEYRKKSDSEKFDPETLLHTNHINEKKPRKKKFFTVKQNSVLNSKLNDFLVGEGYEPPRYSDVMESFSQNLEDVLLERVFEGKREGFYIDIGAADPDFLSVTRHFYDIGWSGINVEPVLTEYNKLALRRPRDINLNCAVGEKEDTLDFFEFENSEFSSFNAEETREDLRNIDIEQANSYPVDVVTLTGICEQHVGEKTIDFLKIDVEGWEKHVLEGMDFSRFRPRVVLLEATKPFINLKNFRYDPQTVAAWEEWEYILLENGYQSVYFDGLNKYYIRSEEPELTDFFRVPLNLIHDLFTIGEYPNLPAQNIKVLPFLHRQAQANMKEIKKLTSQIAACRHDRQLLTAERDALFTERGQIAAHRNAVVGERDQLAGQVQGLTAEKDGLAAQLSGCSQERDAISAERDALAAERDALFTERGQIAAHRNAVVHERDQLSMQVQGLTAERNQLNAHIAGITEEKNQMTAQRNAIANERNQLAEQLRQLSEERAELDAKFQLLSKEKDDVDQQCKKLVNDNKNLSNCLEVLYTEKGRLLKNIDGLRRENFGLTAQCESVEADNYLLKVVLKEKLKK